MNDAAKVVRYEWNSYGMEYMDEKEKLHVLHRVRHVEFVTNADFQKVEGDLFEAICTMTQNDEKIANLEAELASLRGKVGS